MVGKTGVAIRPQDRMSRRSDPEQERSRARQRALLDAAEEILGEVGADGLKMREVARRAESADRLRLSLLSERPRPHPHAGRADARRIARDPGARRRARGGNQPRRGGARACRHHRRRGRLHGEPPDLARRMGRDARRAGTARPRSRRHGGQRANPRPRHRRSPPARAGGGCRRPSRSSSSRAFGARFNSGASFRRKSARG